MTTLLKHRILALVRHQFNHNFRGTLKMTGNTDIETLRTFVALPLPKKTLDQVMEVSDRLQKGCVFNASRPTWVRREAMHLTLAFFGQAPKERIAGIQESLKKCALRFQPQRLEIKQLDVFPNWHRPRVLWMGVRDRSHQLDALQQAVENTLIPFGYKPSENPFKAHLTLARIKSLKDVHALQNIVQKYPRFVFGPIEVERMEFIQSEAQPGGHQYTVLADCSFQPPKPEVPSEDV